MTTYSFKPAPIPFDDRWDVIVVGGGPAGCSAAAAAAREGARTLLLEASGILGGAGTGALVPAWCPFSDGEKIIYRGLAERVFEESKAGLPHVEKGSLDWVPIDAERLKRVYDDLVTSFGASVLFNTFLSAVETDGQGGVRSIVVSNKRGLSALQAKVFIDCTGDADLSAWAGAEFDQGDSSGEVMPATHCFALTNVDEYAYRNIYGHGKARALHGGNPNSPIYKIIEDGKYPLIPDAHLCNNIIGPGTLGFNAGHLWSVDNTDPESVSKALIQGRKMALQFRDALAEYCPEAFANAFLVMTGSQIGIRETRRIIGDYVLTLDDYVARRSFPDEICRNSYFIDVHHAMASVANHLASRSEGLENAMHYGKGESHGIPYRCLLPRSLRNVLVAGRSISCERVVQGSVRVMPVCLVMGEAAGLAAGLASRQFSGNVREVPVGQLRTRLKENGAYLPDFKP